MIDLLSKIIVKYHYALKYLLVHSQRKLFYRNSKSKIHHSFKLGGYNVLDLAPDAVFEFAENVTLNNNNFITVKKNAFLKIGKETYITRATISCLGEIEIGENCILGEGMKLFDHNHKYTQNSFSVSKTDFNVGKIKIGDNVWTGANVVVLKGVTIGNNCIIGTGVLVYKDVPSNSIIKAKQELITHQI
jgi:acetyltransferase-like isoleucine patch superfamily enzyme